MTEKEVQVIEVDEAVIPSIITFQFCELTNLQKSINAAIQKAEQAKESADRAKNKSAGIFQKKEAIELLQSATFDLAESQISATEAHKISFEYQEKLGKIAQYLFRLGVTNLAANRSVVRELELKLKGASEEELNDLARQEIINVVKQLKAQEDIMKKQAELSQKVKQHDEKIAKQQVVEREHEKKIIAQLLKDIEQDKRINANTKKDVEQDEVIANQAEKGKEHDRLIAEQAEKDKKYDWLVMELQEENKNLKKNIGENSKATQKLIAEITHLNNVKTDKKTAIISIVIAVISLVVACIQFFI